MFLKRFNKAQKLAQLFLIEYTDPLSSKYLITSMTNQINDMNEMKVEAVDFILQTIIIIDKTE